MRTWAVMVREGNTWCVYEVDSSRRYCVDVADELRDNGTEAGVMELF